MVSAGITNNEISNNETMTNDEIRMTKQMLDMFVSVSLFEISLFSKLPFEPHRLFHINGFKLPIVVQKNRQRHRRFGSRDHNHKRGE
jgi:hypothetical protein